MPAIIKAYRDGDDNIRVKIAADGVTLDHDADELFGELERINDLLRGHTHSAILADKFPPRSQQLLAKLQVIEILAGDYNGYIRRGNQLAFQEFYQRLREEIIRLVR